MRSRIQRESEGYAARVFEELLPAGSSRRAAARLLADVVAQAGSVTTAWSTTLDPDSVRVNVGPVQLLSLWKGTAWFCATGAKRGRLSSSCRDVSRGAMVYPNSVKVLSRQYRVAAEEITRMPNEMRASILSYVEAAGSKRAGRPLWEKAHSPGVIDFLESYLGVRLPRPGIASGNERALFPDEVADTTFPEGAVKRVLVNSYERSPEARAACIEAFGPKCCVCGFDFGEAYGQFAEGFIHVHHTKPLASIRKNYRVNPIADLLPVCPNCHAAIHLGGVCRSVDDLRKQVMTQNSAKTSIGRHAVDTASAATKSRPRRR